VDEDQDTFFLKYFLAVLLPYGFFARYGRKPRVSDCRDARMLLNGNGFVSPVFFIGVFKATAYNYSCIRLSYTTLHEIIACCRGYTDIGSVAATLRRVQTPSRAGEPRSDPDSHAMPGSGGRRALFRRRKYLRMVCRREVGSPLKGLTP
jgi:hypothetical protein